LIEALLFVSFRFERRVVMVDLSRVRQGGVLAPFAPGFVAWLVDAGYAPHGAMKQLQLFAHVSRWLDGEGLAPPDFDAEAVGRFFADRRASGQTRYLSTRAAAPLLAYLRGIAVVPLACVAQPEGPVEGLLADYERFMVCEREVLPASAHGYAVNVRPFLERFAGRGGLELGGLDGAAVVAFVVATCPLQSRSSAKRTTKALRSFLRFLHAEGHIDRPLAHAVPAASGWRLAGLPKRLEPWQLGALLGSCDRSTVVGRRDFAVILMLGRLGLRAGEVAGLELDDVSWRVGEIVVRGKHGRADRLPLPAEVGDAIVAYLKDGRPASAMSRAVFCRVRAPHGSVSRGGVGKIVRDAGERAGLWPVGAHQLRHTVASEMLRAGGSLAEIGQVLRHQHPQTTAIYAKVDRNALRRIARPWTGASCTITCATTCAFAVRSATSSSGMDTNWAGSSTRSTSAGSRRSRFRSRWSGRRECAARTRVPSGCGPFVGLQDIWKRSACRLRSRRAICCPTGGVARCPTSMARRRSLRCSTRPGRCARLVERRRFER
jgi:integrase/recombinase XerD